MAVFVINTDIKTDTPTIEVTLSADKPLPLGRHRFRLVVLDDSGNKSAPDEVEIIVADQTAPTAVLNVPKVVAFGNSFNLDGTRSFDAGGGKVVQYVWTYLGPSTVIG
jgi:hypothetical protein